jgi:hypothetical protein
MPTVCPGFSLEHDLVSKRYFMHGFSNATTLEDHPPFTHLEMEHAEEARPGSKDLMQNAATQILMRSTDKLFPRAAKRMRASPHYGVTCLIVERGDIRWLLLRTLPQKGHDGFKQFFKPAFAAKLTAVAIHGRFEHPPGRVATPPPACPTCGQCR